MDYLSRGRAAGQTSSSSISHQPATSIGAAARAPPVWLVLSAKPVRKYILERLVWTPGRAEGFPSLAPSALDPRNRHIRAFLVFALPLMSFLSLHSPAPPVPVTGKAVAVRPMKHLGRGQVAIHFQQGNIHLGCWSRRRSCGQVAKGQGRSCQGDARWHRYALRHTSGSQPRDESWPLKWQPLSVPGPREWVAVAGCADYVGTCLPFPGIRCAAWTACTDLPAALRGCPAGRQALEGALAEALSASAFVLALSRRCPVSSVLRLLARLLHFEDLVNDRWWPRRTNRVSRGR
jgi:hypothetical protein